MPPSAPSLAEQPLSDGGVLTLKAVNNKGLKQLRVYRTGFKAIWLYRAPDDRLDELVEAYDNISKADISESFRAKLVSGARLGSIQFVAPLCDAHSFVYALTCVLHRTWQDYQRVVVRDRLGKLQAQPRRPERRLV